MPSQQYQNSKKCCKKISFTVKKAFTDSENEAIFEYCKRIDVIITF